MHEPEMVSAPGCGINSQGQRADPHGGNLREESLLAILEKKKNKKRRTHLPGADCTRTPRQGGQGAWHRAVHAARLWLGGTFCHQAGGQCQLQSHQFLSWHSACTTKTRVLLSHGETPWVPVGQKLLEA